jgi:hypothetical protein
MNTSEHQELLDELVEIARSIEAHRTAVWLLEQRQLQARERLIAIGWKAPESSARETSCVAPFRS